LRPLEGIELENEVGKFWATLRDLRSLVSSGRRVLAENALQKLVVESLECRESFQEGRWRILDAVAASYGLELDTTHVRLDKTNGDRPELMQLEWNRNQLPGVSLVTCCMDRNDNLLKAIPSWVALPEISQIVIVDWSSSTPVIDDVKEAGLLDPRMLIVRVEGETRWILSHAFNVGFRLAEHERVVKADADIVLGEDFFKENELREETFLSGDWRTAETGQEHINGFFYLFKKALTTINGFNEFITTYGWDDDDIYARLTAQGLTRTRVKNGTVFHIPHDDDRRMSAQEVTHQAPPSRIAEQLRLMIRANRFLANTMPTWNRARTMSPFHVQRPGGHYLELRRSDEDQPFVPSYVIEDANFYAAVEILSWEFGSRVFRIDRPTLTRLLEQKTIDTVSSLDIEIALQPCGAQFEFKDRYLVVRLMGCDGLDRANISNEILERLVRAARRLELSLVVADCGSVSVPAVLDEASVQISGDAASELSSSEYGVVSLDDLEADADRSSDQHLMLFVRDELQEGHVRSARPSIAGPPSILRRRPRLYIDAQHGLGNRLRAIASAASIAHRTARDLVVVWEPDHHCECELEDLYVYEGPVEREGFVDAARDSGWTVYNYMEIEEAANKSELIDLDSSSDAYVRSAYVLNSPATSWKEENRFLRSLSPSEAVQRLVSSVRLKSELGVHVRMEGTPGHKLASYDAPSNWSTEGHEQIQMWRSRSHYSLFLDRIDQMERSGRIESIFLAADLPDVYQVFLDALGDRVSYLSRSVFDRSAVQIQYALADVILLSRCKSFMGSNWSSFSELAIRLSEGFDSVQLSGVDF
jgi:hypothetical protein